MIPDPKDRTVEDVEYVVGRVVLSVLLLVLLVLGPRGKPGDGEDIGTISEEGLNGI